MYALIYEMAMAGWRALRSI